MNRIKCPVDGITFPASRESEHAASATHTTAIASRLPIATHEHQWSGRADGTVEVCTVCRRWRGTGTPIIERVI